MDGEELVELRLRRGFKAKEIAAMLGINDATISRYERGHRPIPKPVEYAVRYLCRETETPGQRLIAAMKEALDYVRDSRDTSGVRDQGNGQ